jgi:asparagine synthase (glutamine-hydrolysing)
MCGINGSAGTFIPGLVDRMNQVMAHRGPDGSGRYEDSNGRVAMGHVRLSILDLSNNAAQPMRSEDSRYVITFNGEIYNFKELRQQLERDYTFRSSGDTEVLLRGIEVHGISFVEKLNGMFAFAIWDSQQQELFLARDHLGIKPLYIADLPDGGLAFASEIKSLLVCPGVNRDPDFVALQQHLAFCHASGTRTALAGVKRLPPGSMLRWTPNAGSRITAYWKPDFSPYRSNNYADGVEQLSAAVQAATTRQMVSDVPVGSFLSGGLDSSLLTSIAAKQNPGIECFTVSVDASDNTLDQVDPDLPYAKQLAGDLGLKLHDIRMTSNVAELWPKMVYHLDEPLVDPAVFSCYRICQAARDAGIKVLLSGQGADELFGGYPRYWLMNYWRSIERLPSFAKKSIAGIGQMLPGSMTGKFGAQLRRIRRVLIAADMSPDRRFLEHSVSTNEADIRSIFHPDVSAQLRSEGPTDECLRLIDGSQWSGVSRYYERDLTTYLPNHNLLYTDKIGMATGIEARVPLIDIELAKLAISYPDDWKVLRRTTKRILRDVSKSFVPEKIIRRKKAGFGGPYRGWLRNDLAEMWNDLTSETAVRNRGWFDHKALLKARELSQTGKVDLYMLQMAVLTIELWARQFVDVATNVQPADPPVRIPTVSSASKVA